MLLELGKPLSFLLSLLSLYPLLFSAFFVPGTRFEERLLLSLDKAAIAACCCFASGLIFYLSSAHSAPVGRSVFESLPVRLYSIALSAVVVLFAVSWYLNTYYVPLLWRNLPH